MVGLQFEFKLPSNLQQFMHHPLASSKEFKPVWYNFCPQFETHIPRDGFAANYCRLSNAVINCCSKSVSADNNKGRTMRPSRPSRTGSLEPAMFGKSFNGRIAYLLLDELHGQRELFFAW